MEIMDGEYEHKGILMGELKVEMVKDREGNCGDRYLSKWGRHGIDRRLSQEYLKKNEI